jgi:50S ribosomal subunit-associated GTPase HflX
MSQLETVLDTLKKIGANHQPRLLVVNKVDRFQDDSEQLVWVSRCPEAIQISAVTEDGIEVLTNEVYTISIGPVREVLISLPTKSSKAIDFIEKRTEIISREWEDDRSLYKIRIGHRQLEQLLSHEKDLLIDGKPVRETIERLWPSAPDTEIHSDITQ